jgi:hypothetical protein
MAMCCYFAAGLMMAPTALCKAFIKKQRVQHNNPRYNHR